MINYSIIIPFRDKFELLQKAVDSIPDRSDIQVILIYNGIHEFDKSLIPNKEKLIVLLLKSSPTKGAGHARNVGIENAKGKHILFLDADDYFTPRAFAFFDKYLKKNNDITFFKPTSITLKNGLISNRHIDYQNKIDRYFVTGNEDELRYRWEGPVCKMYRRDFIGDNNLRFDEIKVSNDAWFSLQAGHKASTIQAENSIVYVITEGEEGQSLVKTKTPETIFIRYQVAIKINRFLKSIHKNYLRIRLLGFINIAFREFGILQAIHFTCYAIKKRVSIF